jgi:recombination protein RecR
MLSKGENDIENFGNSVINLKKNLIFCRECYNITENKEKCQICSDMQRDQTSVCVVEEPLDTVAVEKTDYRGKYHVLGGVISPIDGIGPENIRIRELVEKLENRTEIKEIILATDPSLEGEATAMYILELVKKNQKNGKINKDLRITRIARGLPIGGDLEYADEVTLSRALEGRREYL